jgi:hypothetical protein
VAGLKTCHALGGEDADTVLCVFTSLESSYCASVNAAVWSLGLNGRVSRLVTRTVEVPVVEEGRETSMKYEEGVFNQLYSKLAPQTFAGRYRLE